MMMMIMNLNIMMLSVHGDDDGLEYYDVERFFTNIKFDFTK
jgi:hypothetical protein